jgi:hypothetical protein
MKSDVYSFGVLILEILSGNNISYFYQSDTATDLLTHVSMKNVHIMIFFFFFLSITVYLLKVEHHFHLHL